MTTRETARTRHRILARRILDTCLDAQAGDRLWIHTWDHALALASRIAEEARARECQVLSTVRTEEDWLRSLLRGPKKVVDRVPAHVAAALRETDAYVFTLGPRRPVPWSRIPSDRRESASVWLDTRYDRSPYAGEWSAIARARKVRMVGIEATLATPERARALGLSSRRWGDVMWAGCTADPGRIAARGKRLAASLDGTGDVRITASGGTDLRFSLDSRPVAVEDGLATADKAARGIVSFLPSGSVEVSANEDSARGTVSYDLCIRSGVVVRGLRLRFEKGRVISSLAKENGSAFTRYLEEGRDAGKFAFFGFGLNPGLQFGFTQDDKVLGGVTIGLGDNRGKGGRNRATGADWWGCLSSATVTIRGRTVMKEGALRS